MPSVGGTQLATVIDKYAGARLKMRRMELGLSQSAIADELGLTFQQVQKYEKGSNRISTGGLQQLGEIAALTFGDVLTADGEVRREIKLGAHQTKGSKGRTVVLSTRARSEIGS